MKFKIQHSVFIWLLLLTFNAGFLNAATIVDILVPIGNHTGNMTNLAVNIIDGDLVVVKYILLSIFAFFAGGVIAGALFYKKQVGKSRRFGGILITYGIIYLSIMVHVYSPVERLLLVGMIVGSQNGLLTRFKGLTTRTTHITGYLTDAAVQLGRMLRGDFKNSWTFFFYLVNMLSFIAGSFIGCLLPQERISLGEILPGFILIFSGVYYLNLIYDKEDKEDILK